MTTWGEFVAALSESDHARLIIAIGAALQEVRHLSEVATRNGDIEDAHDHLAAAIRWLADVAEVVRDPPLP